MEIGLALALFAALITSIIVLVVRSVGKASQASNIKYHTKANYVDKLTHHFGESKLGLYSVIGDALDQKSGWRPTMEVLFEVLDDNPDLVLEWLVDRYGIVDVRNTLALMDEVDGD